MFVVCVRDMFQYETDLDYILRGGGGGAAKGRALLFSHSRICWSLGFRRRADIVL